MMHLVFFRYKRNDAPSFLLGINKTMHLVFLLGINKTMHLIFI
jgi:hypothetical protein